MDDPDAGLAEWLDAVGTQQDAVVVGHSFGGFLLPLVPAQAHVYLCSFFPVPGKPPGAAVGAGLDPCFGGTVRDELGRSYWPSLEVAADRLYAGHERRWAEWAFPQLRPQAQTVAREPCPLDELPTTRAFAVLARGDPCIRPVWSRETASVTLGREAIELEGGHFPMFDRPRELADVLESLLEELP